MGNKIVSTKKAKKLTSAELRKKKKVKNHLAYSKDILSEHTDFDIPGPHGKTQAW
jgi:hypothetical protein